MFLKIGPFFHPIPPTPIKSIKKYKKLFKKLSTEIGIFLRNSSADPRNGVSYKKKRVVDLMPG